MEIPPYRIDAETNRDYLLDEESAVAYLSHIDGRADLASRGQRVSLLRLLGRLDEAEAEASAALAQARRDGSPRDELGALIRLAHVVQWQRRWEEADRLFAEAIERAERLGDDLYTAFALQHAGRNHIDQGRLDKAIESFENALALRVAVDAPEDQLSSTREALQVARARLSRTR